MLRTALVTAALSLTPTVALANPFAVVPICHVRPNGSHEPRLVQRSTVQSHLAHGDWRLTAEVCGDGVDNDCDNQVDEGCVVECPCENIQEIEAVTSAFPDDMFSLVDFYSETTGELFGLSVADGVEGSHFLVNAYVGSAGTLERYCRASEDGGEDLQSITEAEYEACYDVLESFATELGLIAE